MPLGNEGKDTVFLTTVFLLGLPFCSAIKYESSPWHTRERLGDGADINDNDRGTDILKKTITA